MCYIINTYSGQFPWSDFCYINTTFRKLVLLPSSSKIIKSALLGPSDRKKIFMPILRNRDYFHVIDPTGQISYLQLKTEANPAAGSSMSVTKTERRLGRSEVLTAVVMKSTILWDITPGSPLKVNRRFGGTYRIHLQVRKIRRARYQHESR
jgi:hypothetical protein